ncbi:MAG: hypothetical protein ACKO0V_17755 [bacterium]
MGLAREIAASVPFFHHEENETALATRHSGLAGFCQIALIYVNYRFA